MADKPTFEDYVAWLRKEHQFDAPAGSLYYQSVTDRLRLTISESEFWKAWVSNLKVLDDEYSVKTGYLLLMPNIAPDIQTKPFDSFLRKTFRRNVLDNPLWPEAPSDGWVVPSNWYSQIRDIIRTLIGVKYLDGVSFVAEGSRKFFHRLGLASDVQFEAKEDGYYAGHLYVYHDFEIPRPTWDTERVQVGIEIQITTQLQEVIRSLLHKYYSQRRLAPGAVTESKWQWNYESEEFVANYLGHILHYVEGMIMEVRSKQASVSK